MGLTVFGTAGAVLIFIYWVITGTSLDAPAAPQRARLAPISWCGRAAVRRVRPGWCL